MARHFRPFPPTLAAAQRLWKASAQAVDGVTKHISMTAAASSAPPRPAPVTLQWWVQGLPWYMVEAAGSMLIKGKQLGWQMMDVREGRKQSSAVLSDDQHLTFYGLLLWIVRTNTAREGSTLPSHKALNVLLPILQHAPPAVVVHLTTATFAEDPDSAADPSAACECDSLRDIEDSKVQPTVAPAMAELINAVTTAAQHAETAAAALKPFHDVCLTIMTRFQQHEVLQHLLPFKAEA